LNQYRIFSWVSWIYIILQAFLTMADIQGMALYPPFKTVASFIAGVCFALAWLFLLFVFHYFKQRGFIPWIIGLYGLLSFIDPVIDISHTPAAAAFIRLSDAYVWFHFGYTGYKLIVIVALLSVTAAPIVVRTRWVAIFSILALITPLILYFSLHAAWKDPRADRVVAYGEFLYLLPVLWLTTLFRKTWRFRVKSTESLPAESMGAESK